MWVLNALAGILAVLCILIAIRNFWVFQKRTDILYRDIGEYKDLISYEEMMLRFWVWDIEKLKKPVAKP